mmetsp:Transcript_12047/g.30531  ORF Transcript_12047/g.30531 Transcript_12047/m.30531 type:complete len:200 (-) Transcript_12047:594-1193(-)
MRMNRNDFAAQSTKAFQARHQRQIGTGGIPRQVKGGSILEKVYHAQSFHDGPGKGILGGQRIVHRYRNNVFRVCRRCIIASGLDHSNGIFDTQHVIGLADDHSATVELNHDGDVWRQRLPVDGVKVYRKTSGGCVCLQRVVLQEGRGKAHYHADVFFVGNRRDNRFGLDDPPVLENVRLKSNFSFGDGEWALCQVFPLF